MQGFLFYIKKSPRDTGLTSRPIMVSIGAGVTRIVNFYGEFRGIASGLQVINRDGANTITIIVNNDRVNAFTIPASGSFGMSDQWIEQIEIAAGAAGVAILNAQLTPGNELGIGQFGI